MKAYKSLLEDGHSGFSIGITKQILNRLIDGKPLTPIEDTEGMWELAFLRDDIQTYQCRRMASLFKDIYPDGTVKYHDNDACYCADIDNPSNTYCNGLITRIIHDMFPISMPYVPDNPIKVYCDDFLTDEKNGDYDTIGILFAIKPDGQKIEINRYFKEVERGFMEIDVSEYEERKTHAIRKE